jgi:hypothetical protein
MLLAPLLGVSVVSMKNDVRLALETTAAPNKRCNGRLPN